jgi:hypothetical protein
MIKFNVVFLPLILLSCFHNRKELNLSTFPIGLFDVKPYRVIEIPNNAISVIHDYSFEGEDYSNPQSTALQYLDLADSLGLKTMMGLNRSAVYSEDLDYLASWIKSLKDHPALAFWYLMDEPDLRKIKISTYNKIYKLIKRIDPLHPVVVTIYDSKAYNDFVETSDILMIDPYPHFFQNKSTDLSEMIEKLNIAKNISNNVWASIIAYDRKKLFPHLSNSRSPTIKELRAMAYTALAHNVTGLFFFSYHEMDREYFKNNCLPLTLEIKELSPWVFSASLDIKVQYSDPGIQVSMKKGKGDEIMMIAVNPGEEEKEVLFSLEPYGKKRDIQVEVLFEDRKIEMKEEGILDNFKGFDVHVYKLQPSF